MTLSPGLRRGLLLTLAVVVLLVGALLFIANRALDPDTLRPIAESQLSGVLGSPVTVGSLDVRLLPSPRVEGSGIVIGGAGAQGAPSLQLASVLIVPKVSSLLGGDVAIALIELQGLAFRIRRDAEGAWHLPFGTSPSADGTEAAGTSPRQGGTTVKIDHIGLTGGSFVVVDDVRRTPAGSAEVATISDISAAVQVADGSTSLTSLTGKLGSSTLAGSGTAGSGGLQLKLQWEGLSAADLPQVFGLIGSDPVAGLALEGERPLDLDLSVTPDGAVSGTGIVRAERIAFGTTTVTGVAVPVAFKGAAANATMKAAGLSIGTLAVSGIEAKLSFAGDELRADPVTFSAYGGSMNGRFAVGTADSSRWSLFSTLSGLDMNAFLSANTSARDRLNGTGSLEVNVAGSASGAIDETLEGTVRTAITDGVIRDFGLLAAINTALGLTEGTGKDTNFESLSASLVVGGGKATTRDLRLEMGELRVSAEGTLGFDQQLDFKGRVNISRAKTAQLTTMGRDLKLMANSRGELELPLTVGGTVAEPSFGIDMGALLKTGATNAVKKELEKGLKSLFRKKK